MRSALYFVHEALVLDLCMFYQNRVVSPKPNSHPRHLEILISECSSPRHLWSPWLTSSLCLDIVGYLISPFVQPMASLLLLFLHNRYTFCCQCTPHQTRTRLLTGFHKLPLLLSSWSPKGIPPHWD